MSEDVSDEGMRVQLARMEGKLDMSNLRHEQTATELTDIKGRLHNHSNAITEIRAKQHLQDGERRGVSFAGGLGWKIVTLTTSGGLIAALLKLFVQ